MNKKSPAAEPEGIVQQCLSSVMHTDDAQLLVARPPAPPSPPLLSTTLPPKRPAKLQNFDEMLSSFDPERANCSNSGADLPSRSELPGRSGTQLSTPSVYTSPRGAQYEPRLYMRDHSSSREKAGSWATKSIDTNHGFEDEVNYSVDGKVRMLRGAFAGDSATRKAEKVLTPRCSTPVMTFSAREKNDSIVFSSVPQFHPRSPVFSHRSATQQCEPLAASVSSLMRQLGHSSPNSDPFVCTNDSFSSTR